VPRCARCGFAHYGNPVSCVAFFILNDGRVLLGRRAVEPGRGRWDILGGFVNGNESAEAAVLREALEETNLRVEIIAYLGSIPDVYGARQTPTLNLVYVVRPQAGDLMALSDVAELKWFQVDRIPDELAFAHQREAVAMLREYLSGDRAR
jgi:ADP-ribose pyrophosphatase YjhB (NUDIX family)